MSTIRFGTDGWRAVIGEDFIPENIAQVIQAFADIYPSLPEAGRPVYIGYDRRAQSKESAELIARGLVANNIRTVLSNNFCPTPCVSWHVKTDRAAAGIMVTASHNPAKWNGIKFKESYGGAASPAYTDPIEAQIAKNAATGKKPKITSLPNPLLEKFEPHGAYVKSIKKWADLKLIRDSKFKILADPMYGAGTDYFPEFFEDAVTQIHTEADTNFGGIQPEPIIPHVNEAIEVMKSRKYDICLITDGDADRIGAIDENGTYVTAHQIFSLLIKHIVETRKWRGRIIKSITTTQMINRLCKKYSLELITTPVGFKHISPALNDPKVLIGGEESGGIGIPRHVCERDGVLCGLLLVEMMAVRERRLSELVEELQHEVGPCQYRRIDMHLDKKVIDSARAALKEKADSIKELCGMKVKKLDLLDGYHFMREDDSWLLVRPSGTEPLLRTYAEARTIEEVDALLTEAKKIIGLGGKT
ncbi:MAG: hypothetical protein A3I09_03700 [Deltaproteobacteria bacterium RIFCSPLOWO2_02_FULL_47_10]|nr:MAG: hypothetical protein A3I09_03700 [Deltaproteobacteria bacterium RIFCSPLOWO2_02_FULL_47_10]